MHNICIYCDCLVPDFNNNGDGKGFQVRETWEFVFDGIPPLTLVPGLSMVYGNGKCEFTITIYNLFSEERI